MKAIVLTCDRYRVLTDHMLHTYQQLWPGNPFQFVVPYQEYPTALKDKYGDKVLPVQTPKDIMPTMHRLFETFGDDEWIYWCIDDKYVIWIDAERAKKVHDWVIAVDDSMVRSVTFCRCRQSLNPKLLVTDTPYATSDGQVFYIKMVDSEPWVHQFLRGRVLKGIFANFPKHTFSAKEMDEFYKTRPPVPGQKWLVTAQNLVTLGESTVRGKLTANCVESLKQWGLELPAGFEISDRRVMMGHVGESRWPTPAVGT
jgi:hypothetical protein